MSGRRRLRARAALAGLLLGAFPPLARAASSQPQIDLSSLGSVAVVGSFSGLSFYDSDSPAETFTPGAATLVALSQGGDVDEIGATDAGGAINAICQSPDGLVYIAGNFTSFGGLAASNIAMYDPSTASLAALGQGIDGTVNAIVCNSQAVYVGGDFTAPIGAQAGVYAGHVAEWDVATSAWAPLPFAGLNGAVNSISPSADGRSLFFGGAFSTTFINGSVSSTNISTSSAVNASTFQSLGSSLAPISLNTSHTVATPTSYANGFGRPRYLFCPKGEDGPGSSWRLVDGETGTMTVDMRRTVNARGIRLGNTFYGGRGTQNFSITSLPDKTVLELSYYSNASDSSSALTTCTSECQMAHDQSVPYQDFLFPNATSFTGFEMSFLSWYGAGAGLHLMELLSDGSYAYAVADNNYSPCTAGLGATTQSNVTTTGSWSEASVTSSATGSTDSVLEATVAGGTTTANAPTITWTPYIAGAGNYSIYLHTPGCSADDDCSSRATVSVLVTPSGGTANRTRLAQTNTADASTLIYTGPLVASNSTGTSVTVTMALASSGAPTSGRNYTIVADSISLVAASTSVNTTTVANTTDIGYGVFEYALVDTGTFGDAVAAAETLNATATLTNATKFDDVAFGIASGGTVNSIVSTGSGTDTAVFVGGAFLYVNGSINSTNVLQFTSSAITGAPNGGLAGEVTSLALLNSTLFAAGTFTATVDGSVTGLAGVAQWSYGNANAVWEKVGTVPSALSGAVTSLGLTSNSSDFVAIGGGNAGLATFDTTAASWNSTPAGFFVGNLTAYAPAGNSSNATNPSWLAGSILAAGGTSSPGGALLSAASDGSPQLTALGFSIGSASSVSASNSTTLTRRARRSVKELTRRAFGPGELITRVARTPRAIGGSKGKSAGLAVKVSAAAVNTTLPTSVPATLPSGSSGEVLAGAFWTNGSDTLMVVGGNFVSSDGVTNVGIYDPDSKTLSALAGETIDGSVTVVTVMNNVAWIGGNFTTASGRQGFTTYNLDSLALDDSQPSFTGYGGSNATINAIAQRPGYDETVIIAGAFSSAGLLQCQSICSWDTTTQQWTALGDGLQGAVGAISFAGSKSEYLIAAGQFTLNSTTTYLAQWDFTSQTWTALGATTDLPGPATAVSTDSNNIDKIFVAGQSNLDGSPYLLYWNSTAWSNANSDGLETGSLVSQLVFVPVKSSHASNNIVESDRMLLVSGDLTINETVVSAALFDGASWYPYLIGTNSVGGAGSISSFYYSETTFNLSASHHLSVGIIILISMAIALGVIFLLVLIGLLVALAKRRDEPAYPPQDRRESADDISSSHRGPTELLATVGAATAVMLDGEKAHQRQASKTGGPMMVGGSRDGVDHDSIAGPVGFDQDEDENLSYESHQFGDAVARSRYSFEAEHPGELTVSAGEDLVILEGSDPNWYLVMNGTGQRGLMPASFLA